MKVRPGARSHRVGQRRYIRPTYVAPLYASAGSPDRWVANVRPRRNGSRERRERPLFSPLAAASFKHSRRSHSLQTKFTVLSILPPAVPTRAVT
jgi:hypothetical protein